MGSLDAALPPGSGVGIALLLAVGVLLLMGMAVHVVMSLQKSTTGRSTVWRAAAAAAVTSGAVIAVASVNGALSGLSLPYQILIVMLIAVTVLAAVIRYLYATTLIRACASAAVSCTLLPAMVAILIAVVP